MFNNSLAGDEAMKKSKQEMKELLLKKIEELDKEEELADTDQVYKYVNSLNSKITILFILTCVGVALQLCIVLWILFA